jgi:MYXO-CTERM domain-containing protein
MPLDDDACGAVDCSALDTACRVYHDLTTNRCASLGACRSDNDPAACTSWTDRPCTDAGTPIGDGGGQPEAGGDGGTGDGSGGSCGCASSRQSGGLATFLAALGVATMRARRRRTPPRMPDGTASPGRG